VFKPSGADWSKPDVARESFLLRTDPRVLDALRRWADDELRSVNAQVDFLLRKALKDAGRWQEAEDRTKRKRAGGQGEEPVQ
jgi:hypothetical protein